MIKILHLLVLNQEFSTQQMSTPDKRANLTCSYGPAQNRSGETKLTVVGCFEGLVQSVQFIL
jgi:hypothetical protein